MRLLLFCYRYRLFSFLLRLKIAEAGEIYTWGWKECVPSGKVVPDMAFAGFSQKENSGSQSSVVSEQGKSKLIVNERLHLLFLSSANSLP